jgi:GNAT superfamily N-acetyltransferase
MNLLVRYFPVRPFQRFAAPGLGKVISHPLLLKKNLVRGASPGNREHYVVALANVRDLACIAQHAEAFPEKYYQTRLRRGDTCYCLRVNGEMVAYSWICFTCCSVHCAFENEIEFLQLQNHQAYSYDFYTYRNCRGKGYGSYLYERLEAALLDRGVTELYAAVYQYNYTSLKIHLRMDFDLVTGIANFRILRWAKSFWQAVDQKKLERWIANTKDIHAHGKLPPA